MATQERIVREKEVAAITGLPRATRWRLERAGRFPAKLQLTDTAVGWRLSQVMAWVEGLREAQ